MAKTKLPRSKTRDMEKSPVSGAATRSYETAPKGGNAQKARGTAGLIKVKYSKIPNK